MGENFAFLEIGLVYVVEVLQAADKFTSILYDAVINAIRKDIIKH